MKKYMKGRDTISVQKYKDLKSTLIRILEQREIFWRQCSKQFWLQSGDKNSRYFHASASTRRRTNQISRLKNSEGCSTDWDGGLSDYITEQFTHLFTATRTN